jgi:hypothetical protein
MSAGKMFRTSNKPEHPIYCVLVYSLLTASQLFLVSVITFSFVIIGILSLLRCHKIALFCTCVSFTPHFVIGLWAVELARR